MSLAIEICHAILLFDMEGYVVDICGPVSTSGEVVIHQDSAQPNKEHCLVQAKLGGGNPIDYRLSGIS
jgi:hypothetical protein